MKGYPGFRFPDYQSTCISKTNEAPMAGPLMMPSFPAPLMPLITPQRPNLPVPGGGSGRYPPTSGASKQGDKDRG